MTASAEREHSIFNIRLIYTCCDRNMLVFHFSVVFVFFAVLLQTADVLAGIAKKVEFDGRSFSINGERQLFVAGSVHYPRAPRSEWPSIFQQAKESGVNLIQTYVFWDIHEPQNDQWNFPSDPTSSEDLVAFVQEAEKQGLYVHLRIAGYICAEWNFGGLPGWLRDMPLTMRTYDQLWLDQLSQFVEKTLEVVRSANLLASQGGPIVMLQIENEYGNMENYYGDSGHQYVKWLNDYALSLDVGGVQWIMCQQGEGVGTAPSAAVVNACNGFYCDNWISQHAHDFPSQPHMWTENWPGWFQNWGEPVPHRPAVDVAFAVARWFARGGSYMNYYMLYGGTTYGRSVGGPLIVTSYDYDVQLNEYALQAEPKFSLLQSLHQILLSNKDILLGQMPPAAETLSTDGSCEIHRYVASDDTACISFYSNWGERSSCTFPTKSGSIVVPAWSVSIATGSNGDACESVVYNTKTSVSKSNEKVYTEVSEIVLQDVTGSIEPIPSVEHSKAPAFTSPTPVEQLRVTKDATDYLWYSGEIVVSDDSRNGKGLAGSGGNATLHFDAGTAGGTVFYVFVDGVLLLTTSGAAGTNPINPTKTGSEWWGVLDSKVASTNYFPPSALALPLTLPATTAASYKLDILSVSMGLRNYGPYLENSQVGIVSNNVTIVSNDGAISSLQSITHRVGLSHESSVVSAVSVNAEQTGTRRGRACVPNDRSSNGMCWFTATFDVPASVLKKAENQQALALALNLGSTMGKGLVYVNGHLLGRYWNITATATASQKKCQDSCASSDYVGAYSGDRCRSGCGSPSQEFYKLPRDWIQSNKNVLEIFEEIGGDLSQLRFFTVSMQ